MKKGFVLLLCMFGFVAFATVDLATLIRDVEIAGASERAGNATFWITADEFSGASQQAPNYISLRLGQGCLLSETLVDIVGSANGHDPILLPVGLQTQSGTTSINVPADAISIVRWRTGERRIWLKITASSSQWVLRNGIAGAPSADDRIFVTLGETHAESLDRFQDLFDDDLANAPALTRQSGAQVDAPWMIDLTQSTAQPAPNPNSLIDFDPLALSDATSGVETLADPNGISIGFLPVAFSGDTAIARVVGQAQNRWIYYFSHSRGEYKSDLIFYNPFPVPTTMTLRMFDADGMDLGDVDVDVDGAALKTVSAESLFGNMDVSHCQILGSDLCTVTVTYDADSRSRLTSHVQEGDGGVLGWRYFPEDPRVGKDYMVLVNLGTNDATVSVTALDDQGQTIGNRTLFQNNPLPPKGSALIALQKLTSNPRDVAMLRFNGSQQMGVLAMRSGKTGPSSRILFPVQLITGN